MLLASTQLALQTQFWPGSPAVAPNRRIGEAGAREARAGVPRKVVYCFQNQSRSPCNFFSENNFRTFLKYYVVNCRSKHFKIESLLGARAELAAAPMVGRLFTEVAATQKRGLRLRPVY